MCFSHSICMLRKRQMEVIMKRYDWENALPKETKEFHEKICEVLNALPEEGRIYRMSKKGYVVAALAAIMLFGSISVFAAIKWNERAADNFGADKELQKSLSNEGYSNQDIQTVSDHGITVTLEQTIQDENLIYILFRVASENLELTENNGMGYKIKFSNGMDSYTSISSGFVDEIAQPEIGSSREYEIWIQKNTEYDFEGATLTCDFNALQKYEGKAGAVKDLVTGQWKFNIDLSVNASVEYQINKTVAFDGCDVKIHKIKLSPISYTVYCDGDDIRALQKANNIDFNECDTTYPLIISGIRYKDGTLISEKGALMSEEFSGEGEDFIATGRFTNAIDRNQVLEIIFDNMKDGISIN